MSGVFSTISRVLLLGLYLNQSISLSNYKHEIIVNLHFKKFPKTNLNAIQNENMVKAAFIYQFTQYIDLNKKNFTIAILGNSDITPTLQEIAKRKGNIKVQEYTNLNQIHSCDILFLSKNSSASLASVLSKFGTKPVLIVTEQNGYAKKGAHINFIVNNNKVTFEANLKTARKAGITISSELLKHAVIVDQ